jgi:Domain of unknown function (DUF3576)
MPGSPNSTLFTVISVGLLALSLSACGNPDAVKEDERRMGTSGQINRQINQGLGGRNREDGSLFGPGGLFGSRQEKKDDTGTGVAVNAYLWRASLDTINFIPLVSADPFGGVIITDWYTPPSAPDERFKVNIYILGRALRADGIRASVFRQQMQGAGWVDAPVALNTATDLENAILTRARQMRLAGSQ